MKAVTFWFDPVSPYAHLAFERLPQAFEGLSVAVEYRPILFAGLLGHWGQKGPAEIEPKRAWTFRQVHWLAHQHGIAIDTPLRHPFNPLPRCASAWRRRATPTATTSSASCARRPTRRCAAASSACPAPRSTAACSGVSTPCRWPLPPSPATPGSTAPPGTAKAPRAKASCAAPSVPV